MALPLDDWRLLTPIFASEAHKRHFSVQQKSVKND